MEKLKVNSEKLKVKSDGVMGWEMVRLGEVLNYEQPTAYIVESDMYDNSNKIPVLTAGKSFILGYTNEINGIYENLPAIIFDDFTTESKFVDFRFKVKSSAMKILTCDKDVADIKFLFYLLKTINFNAEQHKRYWISTFANMEVKLPPLATQKRIAEILDAADALRRKDQELLKKYDELAQAIFIDMFGDPVKNEKGWETDILKNVTNKIGSGATPTGGKTAYKKEGISLIRSMNIYDFSFKWKDLAFIDETQATRLNNVTVESKDVLFNITGASVCRCSIVPDELLPARVNQHVAIIRTQKESLNPIFLNHLLVSDSVKTKLLGVGAGGGAVMEAITKDQLEQFEIVLPPIKLQNKFEDLIDNVFSQKSNEITALKESEGLFNSLIQKAFKGELTR
jgi:type I restriction enzyme S subunit